VSRSRLAALALLAVLAAPRPSLAQCQPDGLDVNPCCTPTPVVLPVFPGFNDTSQFICFRDCTAQINANLCVTIDPPQQVISGGPVCGIYLVRFRVKLCGSGQVLWNGKLRAHYSRNWLETDTSGNPVGVWRFLLNGDIRPTAALLTSAQGGNPSVVPKCFAAFGQVYVYGHIDYAFDCNSGGWSAAWAFTHECDSIHHPPSSPRMAPAGGFHPTRSFVFLGPSGFVVDPINTPPAIGGAFAEAVRWNDWSTLPGICRGEEFAQGQTTLLGDYCECTTPGTTGPAQFAFTDVRGMGACGTMFQTLLPPVSHPFLQKRIGHWSNPAVFPGFEFLCLDTGEIEYTNACTGATTNEFFQGTSTAGGFPATDYGGNPLGRSFLDLGSANRNPGNLSVRIGVPSISRYVVNLSLP